MNVWRRRLGQSDRIRKVFGVKLLLDDPLLASANQPWRPIRCGTIRVVGREQKRAALVVIEIALRTDSALGRRIDDEQFC